MIKVTRRGDEPLDKMLRRFKKRCEREGLIKEMKRNEYYEKPSVRKRRDVLKLKKQAEKNARENPFPWEDNGHV